MVAETVKRKTDIGPPHYQRFLPPIIQRNYGKWLYHEIPRPGVLLHVSESGERLFTVRAGSPRLLSTQSLRLFASLADEFSDGYLRFTSRNNIEFLLTDGQQVAPLIERLESSGYPVGGTGASITSIVHTQGWVHCHSAPLLIGGIRCLGRCQVSHGRAVSLFWLDAPARARSHCVCLLPQHVRSRALFGHRHLGPTPKTTQDQSPHPLKDL